jgi:hypothetical protein
MSLGRDTAKSSAQKAIDDLVKYGLGALWLAFAPKWLSGVGESGFGLTTGQAFAWAIVLAILLPFVLLFAKDWWRRSKHPVTEPSADIVPTDQELDQMRLRILEYHAMHLSWFRSVVIDGKTPDGTIDDGPRVIEKHRDALLNLTPQIFPLSVAETFRSAAVNFGERRPQVAGYRDFSGRRVRGGRNSPRSSDLSFAGTGERAWATSGRGWANSDPRCELPAATFTRALCSDPERSSCHRRSMS